jgi:hypothetical protein
VEEDKPCIVEEFDKNGEIFNAQTRMYETAPRLKWLNFAKLPSPRQAIFFQTAAVFRPLPDLTYCSTPAEPDSSALDPKPKGKFFNCSESFTIFGHISRRINALDYIRKNFCAGLPEPPPPPPKPY